MKRTSVVVLLLVSVSLICLDHQEGHEVGAGSPWLMAVLGPFLIPPFLCLDDTLPYLSNTQLYSKNPILKLLNLRTVFKDTLEELYLPLGGTACKPDV